MITTNWSQNLKETFDNEISKPAYQYIQEHSSPIQFLKVTKDGKFLAYVTQHTLKVLDIKTKTIHAEQKFSTKDVIGIDVDPKENVIYVGLGHNVFTVRAYSLDQVLRLTYPTVEGTCVAFRSSFDSYCVFAGFTDGTIKILDPKGDLAISLDCFLEGLTTITIINESILLAASRQHITLFNMKNSDSSMISVHRKRTCLGLVHSLDQKTFVVNKNEWTVQAFRIDDSNEMEGIYEFSDPKRGQLIGYQLTSDGYIMITATNDGRIQFHDLDNLKQITELILDTNLSTLSLTEDDLRFYLSEESGQIQGWNLIEEGTIVLDKSFGRCKKGRKGEGANTLKSQNSFFPQFFPVYEKYFVKSKCVNFPMTPSQIRSNIKVVIQFVLSPECITSICSSEDGKFMIVGDIFGSIKIIDSEEQSVICEKAIHSGAILALRLSQHENYLISSAEDETFKIHSLFLNSRQIELTPIYDVNYEETIVCIQPIPTRNVSQHSQKFSKLVNKARSTSKKITKYTQAMIKQRTSIAESVQALLSSERIALLTIRGVLTIFHLDQKIFTKKVYNIWWRSEEDYYDRLSVSGDGHYILIGGNNGAVSVIDTTTIEIVDTYSNLHSTMITAQATSHDGLITVTGSYDGQLTIMNQQNQNVSNLQLPSQNGRITQCKMHADGRYVVVTQRMKFFIFDVLKLKKVYEETSISKVMIAEFCSNRSNLMIGYANGKTKILSFYFLHKPSIIDYSLNTKYRALSKLPDYKLKQLYSGKMKITKDVIENYQMVYHFPSRSNLWFFIFLWYHFRDPSEIVKWLIDFKIPIENDINNQSIIHNLIESKRIVAINMIFSRSEELFKECPDSVFLALSNQFLNILKIRSFYILNFLAQLQRDPIIQTSEAPLRFGQLNSNIPVVFTNSPRLSLQIQQQLYQDGKLPLSFYLSKIAFNTDPNSKENLMFLSFLQSCEDDQIFKSQLITKLIEWLWIKGWYTELGLFILNLGYFAILVAYIVSGRDSNRVSERILQIFSFLFIFLEALKVLGGVKIFIKDIWNLLSLASSSCAIWWFSTTDMSQSIDVQDTAISLTVFFTFFRLVGFFRLNPNTKKLVRVGIEVIKDLIGFGILGFLLVLGFSLIFYRLQITAQESSFGVSWRLTYEILFQSFHTDQLTGMEYFYFTVLSLLFYFIILNILIAQVLKTFRKIEDNYAIYKERDRVDLAIQSMLFRHSLVRIRNIFRRCKRDTKPKSNLPKQFIWAQTTLNYLEQETEQSNASSTEKYLQEISQTLKEMREEQVEMKQLMLKDTKQTQMSIFKLDNEQQSQQHYSGLQKHSNRLKFNRNKARTFTRFDKGNFERIMLNSSQVTSFQSPMASGKLTQIGSDQKDL